MEVFLGIIIGVGLAAAYVWMLKRFDMIVFTGEEKQKRQTVEEILAEERVKLDKDKLHYQTQLKSLTAINTQTTDLKRFAYMEVVENLHFVRCKYDEQDYGFNILIAEIGMNPKYGYKAYIPAFENVEDEGENTPAVYAWFYFDELKDVYDFLETYKFTTLEETREEQARFKITGVNINDAIRNLPVLYTMYIEED